MDLLNNGYYNSQAVQVLNAVEYDEFDNPIGLYESPSDPSSCNFAVTDNNRCKFVDSNCFQQQVSTCYMTVTGLLATDTVTVFGSSSIPTLSTGRMDFTVGSKYYGISIFRSGVLWAYYPMCESIINPAGHTYHDVSGNGNHATLINGSVGNEGKQNEFHYLQKGFNLNIKKALGDSSLLTLVDSDTTYVSSKSSSIFTYNKTIAGALSGNGDGFSFYNLRPPYIGDIWKFKFKIRYNYSISNIIFRLRSGGHSGYLIANITNSPINFNTPNTWIDCEAVGSIFPSATITPSVMFQVDFATITNGTIVDIDLNYIELVNPNFLPKHLTNNTDYLGNSLEFQQDDKSFLPSGCYLQQYSTNTNLKTADSTVGLWYGPEGDHYKVSYNTLCLQDPWNEQVFIGNKTKDYKLGPISTHYNNLTSVQKLTERVVRNVVDDPLIDDPAFSHDVTVTASDLTYSFGNTAGYIMNGIIDWGDGTTQSVNTAATQTITKTYSAAGTYTVKFTGVMNTFSPAYTGGVATSAVKIVRINNWGNVGLKSLSFFNCSNLVSIPNTPITGLNATSLSVQNLFFNCAKLTSVIPDNLLIYATASTSLANIFSGCLLLTGQIPENLFRYCPNLTSVASAFQGCTGLTGQIPEELLKYNTKLTTVASLFNGCTGLSGSIPENLLKYNTLLTNTSSILQGCSKITGQIPSTLLTTLTELTTIDSLFGNCTGLTSTIPIDFLRYNTKLTTAASSLLGCTGITGNIPVDYFRYNVLLTNVSRHFRNTRVSNIPSGLFQFNTAITTYVGVFQECVNITTIPTDLFSYSGTNTLTFEAAFDSCTGITSIPTGLFDYNTNVTTFASTFKNTRITTIPSNLFVNNTKVTSFSYTFAANPSLSGIPSNLFDTNTLVTTFDNVFIGCTGITSIPTDLFKFNTLVTNMSFVFYNTRITAIPADLFRYNTLVTSFHSCFRQIGTTNILNIPIDIFRYNVAVTNMSYVFSGTLCSFDSTLFQYNTAVTDMSYAFQLSRISTIPSGLFDYNINITTFFATFNENNISSIPADLFKYNTKVTTFGITFNSCPITTIPSGLFDTNTLVTSFAQTFGNKTIAFSIPEDLFYFNSNVTNYASVFVNTRNLILPTRLFNPANLSKVTNWTNFLNVTQAAYSPTGTIQKIWDVGEGGDVTYTVQPTKTDAFNNCTALSNYAEIPVAWT